MKQIFLLEDGISTYLALAATAEGKKVYVADPFMHCFSLCSAGRHYESYLFNGSVFVHYANQ